MEPELKEFKIDYGEGERLVAHYATHMTVQATPIEFVLSFYQVFPPLLSGSVAEQQEQLAKLDKVEARCVARIAVGASRIAEFLRVLGEQAKHLGEGAAAVVQAQVQAQEKSKQ